MDQRVRDAGVVMRQCGSCGQRTTLQVVEYHDRLRWGPFRVLDRTVAPYRLATCSACHATFPARSTDIQTRVTGDASGAGWDYSRSA